MLNVGLNTETVAQVRRGGGAIFPTFYGENFANATDQIAIDFIPSPDRGPYVITSVQGLPFVTTSLTRGDRVSMRAGGNDLQFAPFLASGVQGNQTGVNMGATLPYPILIPPGASFFIRNTIEGAAGVVVSGSLILHGFHTDKIGARIVARYGQPWVIPITHDHAATAQTQLTTERQLQRGCVEVQSLTPGFFTAPDLFDVRFRGVQISQGANIFGLPTSLNNPIAQGCAWNANAVETDAIVIRTVYTATPGNAYKANIWTRRVYRAGDTGC